jgi:hypothetical protein
MICLTFDTDWMSEAALSRFVEDVPIPGRATFFCHTAFTALAPGDHEVCPHPFITNLDDWRGPLEQLRLQVNPAARGTRPHSCVFSHMVGLGLHEMGFEYVSQANNLYQSGLRPFRHPWGVWELPIYYMDNMDFWASRNWPERSHQPFSARWIEQAVRGPDLYVFDFHPIHLALNTRSPEDYEQVKRRVVDDGVSPFDLRFAGRGARTYFDELCAAMAAAELRSFSCSEAIEIWDAVPSISGPPS